MRIGSSNMDNMYHSNWDDLRFLLALSRFETTSETATQLNVSHQTVSRRLTALEQQFKARLIDRSATPWRLTPIGEQILAQAEKIEACVSTAQQLSRADHHDISGLVRITSTSMGLERIVMPCLEGLQQNHPKLEFDLRADSMLSNMQSGEFDLALRFSNNPPQELIGKYVGDVSFAIYGHSALIETFDAALKSKQPITTPILNLVPPHGHQRNIQSEHITPQTPTHWMGDIETLLRAVKMGIGVGLIPSLVGAEDKNLRVSSLKVPNMALGCWILRHQETRQSAKFRAIEAHIYKTAKQILEKQPK